MLNRTPQTKGIISCIIIIIVLIWKSKSLAATIISSMIATTV
jgi:hypothetical protein